MSRATRLTKRLSRHTDKLWAVATGMASRNDARTGVFVLATIWAIGAVVGLLALVAAQGRAAMLGPLVGLCLVTAVAATAAFRFGALWPSWAFHAAVAATNVAVAVSAWLAGPGTMAITYGMLLVVFALYVGYFFAPAAAFAHGSSAIGVYWLVLIDHGQPLGFELVWLAGCMGLVATVSRFLAESRALAEIDPLTGLENRRGLSRTLSQAILAAERTAVPLACGLLEIEGPPQGTDRRRMQADAQRVLACVPFWQALLPPGATLSRRGEYVFAVTLPNHTLLDARVLVDRLREAAPGDKVTAASVASWSCRDSESLLVSRADAALYEAKRSGHQRTEVAGDLSDLAAEIWSALADGQFVVHYQPIMDLASGALTGAEALVRWQHPERGLLAPGMFLDAAETSGAIHALGRWVLDQACDQLSLWMQVIPSREIYMSVNISPHQLQHPPLLTDVAHALERCRLPAGSLVLEITEGALHAELTETVAVLDDLRKLGVILAIDDFGTGHSSLSRLRNLPFDILKIDRSFVTMTDDDQAKQALLTAIVGLAGALGLTTIAEGIETGGELRRIRAHGCQQAQGYLLGRPVPATDLRDVIHTGVVVKVPA